MDQPPPLQPAAPADVEQALAHALLFDGRKPFRTSGEIMARITATHVLECLRRAGFVVMRGQQGALPRAPDPLPATPPPATEL